MTAADTPAPYVDAVRVGALFADPAYQRDVDERRVTKMVESFDRRLVGVLEVSDRGDGTYAVLDGQHRAQLVLRAGADGIDTPVVCQVYTGLTVKEEAELFHELNARRKALSTWDRWKARRASGDERVAAIEQVLANHGLQVSPDSTDGNVHATTALEVIADKIGDLRVLDTVIVVLVSAFGRARQGFDGGMMQGLALVLTAYHRDELDMDRLVNQLRDVPVRQMKARASGMRELHRGTYPRLFAGVIVEQYNRGPGRNLESFFTRLPERAIPRRASATARPDSHPAAGAPANGSPHKPGSAEATNSPIGPPQEVGEPGVRHESRPAPGADLTGTSTDRRAAVAAAKGKVGGGVAHASPPAPPPRSSPPRLPPNAAMAVCTCGHT